MGVEKLSEIEICLSCGEEMTYWFVIQNSVVFQCFNCDDDGGDDGLDDGEQPCLCREDHINPFCPSCF